jgi:hypothetical protein
VNSYAVERIGVAVHAAGSAACALLSRGPVFERVQACY